MPAPANTISGEINTAPAHPNAAPAFACSEPGASVARAAGPGATTESASFATM